MIQRPHAGRGWLAGLLLATALMTCIGVGLVVVSGPLYRLQWLALGEAVNLLRAGATASLILAVFSVLVLGLCLARRRIRLALVAGSCVLLAAVAFALPWSLERTAADVPPIHDISTDTDNPPAFVDLAAAREEAPNAVAYPGAEFARQQHEAYPDIAPLLLDAAPADAFRRAQRAAAGMGWEIVAADAVTGRIEATATTTWFGFRDDVVIRVKAMAGASRIDVRSASRVGRSDLGTNAARIRAYLDRV